MNWLNLEVSTIRAREYVGSEPVQRATWLNVLAYSAEHENGGRIVGARLWKDRTWQQTCGVTKAEVDAAAELLIWDGDDLTVWRYPVDKEAEVKARREYGRTGGIKSGASRREAKLEAPREAHLEGELEGELEAKANLASTERKGMEGEGKGIPERPLTTRDRATAEQVRAFEHAQLPPHDDGFADWWHDAQEASGWIGKNQIPVADWKAAYRAARSSHRHAAEEKKQRQTTYGKPNAHDRTAADREFERTGIKPAHIPTNLL